MAAHGMAIDPPTSGAPGPLTERNRGIRQFLTECTVTGLEASDVVPVADLYGMYLIWCERTSAKALPVQVFSQRIRADGIEAAIRRGERVLQGMMATGPIPVQYILETDKGLSPNSPFETRAAF